MTTKNISLLGATYSNVPGVTLPVSGGGSATFYEVSDTTAEAADVATGKYFYTASGVKTEGTNSGGGGGASNIVQGTFTTGASRNSTGTVNLNYSGNGYPIACFVYISGGAYNNTTSGNTEWYNSLNRYDVGFYSMVKSRTTTTPTYSNSGEDNYGTVSIIYKNSTSVATTYARTSSMTSNVFVSPNSTSPATASTGCVRFLGAKKLGYYIGNKGSGTIGFPPSTEMAYIIIYSS